MLDFFRRHQRYFFLVITVVIVISFSFFGTYSTLGSDQWREQIAFKAVDGSDITRIELDEMATFLSSDNEDKILFGGAWGPNFLNDGVIRKNFLQTGMGEQLINAYVNDFQDDLAIRHEREKKYTLYSHPQAKFLSVANAWNYFAPEMHTHFNLLKQSTNPTDKKAVNARVQLYLTEKKIPSSTLKQVIKFQQQQYSWLTQDPNLDKMDLSLFGYHTLEDWFGPRFVRLVSQFIINTAIIAEEKGYRVSRAEALADLMKNTDISYQQNMNRSSIGVANPSQYLNEQLRILRMDQTRAVKIWQQVMLFRRFFNDVGNAALVDAFTFKHFNNFSKEAIELDVYRLPQALRFGSYNALQRFEVYLNAVSNRPKDGAALLKLPNTFLSVDEVSKQYPELVQRKYKLELAQVDKKNLQARISLKDTWAWELDEANWKTLQTKFPELGVKPSKTRDERMAALDELDALTRSRVDAFARSEIVDSHPDWIQKAFDDSINKTTLVGLRYQGGVSPFAGLEKNPDKQKELMALLDKATTDAAARENLKQFSADGQTYYRIAVLERSPQQEILTFEEASQDGTLDQIRDKLLEKYYGDNRQSSPLLYQNPDGSWKEFGQVKELVAESYFANIVKAIQDDRNAVSKEKMQAKPTHDEDAAYRLYAYAKDALTQLKKDPAATSHLVKQDNAEQSNEKLATEKPLQQQWLFVKEVVRLDRSDENPLIDEKEAFSSSEKGWSTVRTVPNGDLVFFQMLRSVAAEEKEIAVAEQTRQAHTMLADDAQRILTSQVLKELKEKNALSLSYLKQPIEEPAE